MDNTANRSYPDLQQRPNNTGNIKQLVYNISLYKTLLSLLNLFIKGIHHNSFGNNIWKYLIQFL